MVEPLDLALIGDRKFVHASISRCYCIKVKSNISVNRVLQKKVNTCMGLSFLMETKQILHFNMIANVC